MNFTSQAKTTASETTYDRFCSFKDCCDLNQVGLSANALKQPFVGKVRKI